MKFTSTLLASALLAVSAGAAMADTMYIGSYGTNQGKTTYSSTGKGFINTALGTAYSTGSGVTGTTYDLNSDGVWASAVGGSSWVGLNANDDPNGSNHEANGTYAFYSTFVLSSATNMGGTITVMADDTADVYLNGTQIVNHAAPTAAAHCTVNTPNCEQTFTASLTGLITGTNVLEIVDYQDFDHASGVDFAGQIGVTPEPSSLLLLGSGLSTVAGLAFRRRRVQA